MIGSGERSTTDRIARAVARAIASRGLRGLAFGSALAACDARVVGAQGADASPTFARDIVPIFQAKCQVCHQPNSIAPMSLLTYEDAKKYASRIRARVVARVMPPWHIDKTVGIQAFKNDRGLSDAQIETISRWVDAGAPPGDPKDMPPAVKFPDPNRWQLSDTFGPPDLVIRSKPFTMPASGEDKWFRPVVETGLTDARWVRAIEVRPSYPDGRKIVHHALTYLLQDEKGVTGLASTAMEQQMNAGLFMEWAVGKTGQIFPPDAGKLMLPGSRIRWEIHVHAMGQEVKDNIVELAVYFYPKGYVPPAPYGVEDVRRHARPGSRHPAERKDRHTELLRDAGAGAAREFPAAHAHARPGDVDGGGVPGRPARSPERRQQLPVEVARQLRLRRHGRSAAAEGHDARVHRVA